MALISLKAAAERLAVSEGSIRNLISSQAIEGYALQIKGKRATWRVESASLDAYLERCRVVAAPAPVQSRGPRRASTAGTVFTFLRHRNKPPADR